MQVITPGLPTRARTVCAAALALVGAAAFAAPVGAAAPTVPGAPAITSVISGVRSVRVAFTKPADNGGAKITNYRVRCTSSDGGKAGAHEAMKSPIVVSGLTAGKTYTCTVAARNKVGLGTASSPSDPVVPLAH